MTRNIPTVSIILPAYNAEMTLQRAVESVLAQSFTDFEMIIVNDGSKDKTGSIADTLAKTDSRIIVIHKANGGVSAARNDALDKARGEWIAFIDADDEVMTDWLEVFVKNIGDNDLCVQGIRFIGKTTEDRFLPGGYFLSNRELVECLITTNMLGYLFSKIFRRNIIEANHIRFDVNIRFREDDVFQLQYAEYMNGGVSVDRVSYIYYVPEETKNYGTSSTQCTELLLDSLNRIFAGDIPDTICNKLAWSVKGEVVSQLLAGKKLSAILLNAYKKCVASNSTGIKARLLDRVILNSPNLGSFSTGILKLIHRRGR